MINKETFFTVEQLCGILGIGRNTAYELLKAGDIRAFRIGRNWKIPKTSIDKYVLESMRGDFSTDYY